MGLLKGREIDSLLIHASIPILMFFFGISVYFLSFFFLYLFIYFTLLFFFFLPLFLAVVPPPSLLFTTMAFYTACCDRIYRVYPLTAFGSLWVSFQDYPLACRLPNHYHYTVLAAPHLIPKQKWFCFVSYFSLFSILLSG